MRRNRTFQLLMISILVAVLGLVGFKLVHEQPVIAQVTGTNLPPQIRPCLPRNAKSLELLGKVQDGQKTYFLLGAFLSSSDYWQPLIQLEPQGCLSLRRQGDLVKVKEAPEGTMPAPISNYVPQAIADSLLEQRYRKAITHYGSLMNYQQVLNQTEPGVTNYWYPEEVRALQKLGLQIPKTDVVINSYSRKP